MTLQLNRTTDGGISFSLMAGYPKITAEDLFNTKAVEKIVIKMSDAPAFYNECFPFPIVRGNFIELPARRRMPGTGFLITKTANFEPFTGELPGDPLVADAANSVKYDQYCMVTINYEVMLESDDNPRDPEKPETFLIRQLNAGGEFMTINPKKTGIADVDAGTEASGGNSTANKDMLMPFVKVVPTIEWSMTWPFAIAPNWTEIFDQLGTVNDGQYLFLNSAEVETVLFAGVSGSQTHFWTGKLDTDAEVSNITSWSLDLKFSQRRIKDGTKIYGWNHVWSPDKQKFVKPTIGDKQLYVLSDFEDLFTADPAVIA